MGKRLFDIIFSSLGLLVLSPILAALSALVKLSSPGPVIFKQVRMGLNQKPFSLYKFRTMKLNAETEGPLITSANDSRVTGIGRLLRKSKLDELPQLFNILKGEMSFVGPRPEVPRYVQSYTPEQLKVFSAKPGITDPATVHFRNEEQLLEEAADRENFYVHQILPQKLKMNLEYLGRSSILNDLKIIFQTILRIVKP